LASWDSVRHTAFVSFAAMLQIRRGLGRSKLAPTVVILVLFTFWLLYGNEEYIYGLSGGHGRHRRPPITFPDPGEHLTTTSCLPKSS
jgi:hypothetical protein